MNDEVPNKHALYTKSERARRPHTCTIECSGCREETRVNYIELAALMFPVNFHLPLIRYHQSWLKCPSCGKRTWVRIHLDR